ncbi:MAG: hypothetical protein IJC18_01730, partial [Clostridia bacterium]|nr:hypothetical protein [Clostridia bacterium]
MKLRRSLLILLVGALLTVFLKTYQLLSVVDLSTGFYTKGNASVIILPVIIVLFIAAFGISSFACDEYPKFSPNHRSYPLGLVSAVTAVVFGYVSAAELIDSGERMFTGPAGIVYSVFGLLSVVSFSF